MPALKLTKYLTIQEASEQTGISIDTFYNLRRDPGCGLTFYQRTKGGRLMLKEDELARWMRMKIRQVPITQLDANRKRRSKEASGACLASLSRTDRPLAVHGTSGAGRSFTN